MATAGLEPTEESPDEYRTVTVGEDDGRRLAYAEYGATDGVPVVFLHGIPGSRRLGQLLDTVATERGVRVLAPDRPGYGQSPSWSDQPIRDAGTVVTAVLDDNDVRTAGLVAFSGGAPHALATAAEHPDRVARVDILAGATPPSLSEQTPAMQRLLNGLATTTPGVLGALFRGQAWLADRRDPSFVVAQYTTGDPSAVPDETAAVAKTDFVEAVGHSRSGAVSELRATATEWDIDYAEIEPPVAFWHGEDDTNVPLEDARRLAAQFPSAEMTVLDGADHLRTLLRSVPQVLDERGRQA